MFPRRLPRFGSDPLQSLIVLAGTFAVLAALPGGCPSDPSAAGLDPKQGLGALASDPNSPDAGDQLTPAAGESPVVADVSIATPAGTPVSVMLVAETSSDSGLVFAIESPPASGSLGEIVPVTGKIAEVEFTPAPGFTGVAQFSYVAEVDGLTSAPGTVLIQVYPDLRFAVEPTDGRPALNVLAAVFTVSGAPLPNGTFQWWFDNEPSSQSMNSHGEITHVFRTGGKHTVRLTLTIAGLTIPVSCSHGPANAPERADVTVWPTVTGLVRGAEGDGIADVRVELDGTDEVATTDSHGIYSLPVPYGATGVIKPYLDGAHFAPTGWSFSNLKNDIGGVDFRVSDADGTLTVSGYVRKSGGQAIGGVTVRSDGGVSTTTSSAGFYSLTLESPFTGAITAVEGEYTFSPAARDYSDQTEDLENQNFTGTLVTNNNGQVPVVFDTPGSTPEDTPATFTLEGSDGDSDDLTFAIVDQPDHGDLGTLNNAPGEQATVEYTPDADYYGTDTFKFKAVDGNGNESDVATFTISVLAVNDPPSFTIPPPNEKEMGVGATLAVTMESVDPGAKNESQQVVTFTAVSDNQSVIPDSNLVFVGNQLKATAIATTPPGEPVRITVTATDDGGNALGGDDTSDQDSFYVNVLTDVTLSGTVDDRNGGPYAGLVMVARNDIGQVVDYTMTDAGGNYTLAVPTGSSGTVEASDDYHLSPESIAYDEVSAPITNIDFVGFRNYYVAPGGSDSFGGIFVFPFATVQHAADVAQPGDWVILREGTYDASTYPAGNSESTRVLDITSSGTAAAPIAFKGYPGEVATLDGRAINKYCVYITGDYVVLDGLTIANAKRAGVVADGVTEGKILNCVARDNSRQSGAYDPGIRLLGACRDCVVDSCELYGNGIGVECREYPTAAGHRIYPGGAVPDGSEAPEDCVIQNCYAHDNNTVDENSDGFADRYGTRNQWLNNVAYNNGDDGMDLLGCLENRIEGNVVFGHPMVPGSAGDGNGIKCGTRGGGGNILTRNACFANSSRGFDNDDGQNDQYSHNIAYGNGGWGFLIEFYGTQGNVLYNNASVGNNTGGGQKDVAIVPGATSDYNFWGDGIMPADEGAHTLSGNPGFEDPTFGGDDMPSMSFPSGWSLSQKLGSIRSQVADAFTLLETSPCVDSAFDVGLGATAFDVPGVANTGAGATNYYDRGAFELVLP